MPANIAIADNEIRVRFHRRAHLPIVLACGLIDKQSPSRGGTDGASGWSNSLQKC
jgi:hypothetical protein